MAIFNCWSILQLPAELLFIRDHRLDWNQINWIGYWQLMTRKSSAWQASDNFSWFLNAINGFPVACWLPPAKKCKVSNIINNIANWFWVEFLYSSHWSSKCLCYGSVFGFSASLANPWNMLIWCSFASQRAHYEICLILNSFWHVWKLNLKLRWSLEHIQHAGLWSSNEKSFPGLTKLSA